MVKMIVLLTGMADSLSGFGEKYNDFLMKMEHIPNVKRKAVSDVFNAPHAKIPFRRVVELYFESREVMEAALLSEAGIDAGRFLLEFAGQNAITLFANVLEEEYPTVTQ